jgi:hypothetical protein
VTWSCEYIDESLVKVKVKGIVVPVLPLTEYHAMKAYGEVGVQLHPLFDLGNRRR